MSPTGRTHEPPHRRRAVTRYHPGDDVVVTFQGVEMQGEVIWQGATSGYVMAVVINPDPELDMGSISAAFDPRPTVCVPASKIRLARLF